MIEMELTKPELRRLRRKLKRAPEMVFDQMRRAFVLDGIEWESAMIKRFGGVGINRSGGSRPGGKLAVRTGALRRSLSARTTGSNLRNLELRAVSAGTSYAGVQEGPEQGGFTVIKPKRSKYLTIPIDDNLTAAGVPRFPSARALLSRDKKARFLKTKSGELFIVRGEKGVDDNVEFLFVLKRSVKVPGRLRFFATWRSFEKKRFARHTKAIRRALDS